ncbi:MAG TPA: carboxymuconolactone decarboxylase family protein, partial [Acidimicrobiales bacterium]
GGEPPRVFTTLARHPRLFRRWLAFAAALLFRGRLPPVDRELVTLRTAWRCASAYVWVQHVRLARRAGLPPASVARVPDGPGAPGWTPRQRLLLLAADEIHDHRVITDRTWAGLAVELDERQLIELCLLAGHYEMLAATLNSLGVQPEPSALDRLDGAGARSADELQAAVAARRVEG